MSMGSQRVGNDLATKPQSINNVVLISGTQQNNLIIHVFGSILFQILFPVRLLQNIEQSSLYYTVGPFWSYHFKYK